MARREGIEYWSGIHGSRSWNYLNISQDFCANNSKIILSMKSHWNDAPNCLRQSNDAIFSLARSISTKCALLALHNWWQTLFYTRLCCIMINFIDPFRKSWFASLRVCLWVWAYLSVFFSPSSFFPSRCLNWTFFGFVHLSACLVHVDTCCNSCFFCCFFQWLLVLKHFNTNCRRLPNIFIKLIEGDLRAWLHIKVYNFNYFAPTIYTS